MITIKRQLRKNNRKLSTRTKNNGITKSPQKLDHVTDETESDWLYYAQVLAQKLELDFHL